MSGFLESFTSSGEDGTALTNTTTATSIIPASRRITLPAATYWDYVGQSLHLRAAGRISTAASSPGTLQFLVKFGSTTVFDGGASATLATSAANLTWVLDIVLTCRLIGSSATVLGTGTLITAALSATTPIMLLPISTPAVGTAFDATVSQTVDLFAAWSVASASNTLTCHQFQQVGIT